MQEYGKYIIRKKRGKFVVSICTYGVAGDVSERGEVILTPHDRLIRGQTHELVQQPRLVHRR